MEGINLGNELLRLGFDQHFPFVAFFTKGNIHVHTCYKPLNRETIADSAYSLICNQIIVFDLPKANNYLYQHDENALQFIKSIIS